MFSLFNKSQTETININDIDSLGKNIQLIDIREGYEYERGSHKLAKHVPMSDLLSTPAKFLNKGEKYYIMCQSGVRSGRTTTALATQGYEVINVAGGMGSYVGVNRI